MEINNIIWQAKYTKKKNWLKASKILEEAIKDHPKEPKLYIELANIYNQKKLYRKGVEYLEKAYDLDKFNDKVKFKLGNTLLALGEHKLSVNFYDLMQTIFPEAEYNKAIALSKMGKYEESVECLEELINIKANSPLPYYLLAEQYFILKDFEKAISLLKVVEKKFGKNKKIHYLRGLNFFYQKNWLKAYLEFTEAAKMNMKGSNFQRMFGMASEKIGKMSQAIEYYFKSLKSDPFDANNYLQLIQLFIKMEKIDEAWKLLKKAEKLLPMSPTLIVIKHQLLTLKNKNKEY